MAHSRRSSGWTLAGGAASGRTSAGPGRWMLAAAAFATAAAGLSVSVTGVVPSMAAAPARARWHQAIRISLPLNAGRNQAASLYGVSCVSVGSCVAGGGYESGPGRFPAMVVARSGGRWQRARELRMPPDAAAQPNASVFAVSCATARWCVAVGFYLDTADQSRSFIATETQGRWARAAVPRLPANALSGGSSELQAVVCLRPGSCVAGGGYTVKGTDVSRPMIMTESGGRWGRARQIAVASAIGHSQDASIAALACPRKADCSAVGFYFTSSSYLPLRVTESNGRWGPARTIQLPPNATRRTGSLLGVSCPAARTCVAVGFYVARSGGLLPMAMTKSRGRWNRAIETALPAGNPTGALIGVSCTARGSCVAVGDATSRSGAGSAMAVTETAGRWRSATIVGSPTDAAIGAGQGQLRSIACFRSRGCIAVGSYTARSRASFGMAATQTP